MRGNRPLARRSAVRRTLISPSVYQFDSISNLDRE